jgi:phosphate transport system permease protein
MSDRPETEADLESNSSSRSIENGEFKSNIPTRNRSARIWQFVFQVSTIIGIIVLSALLINILNSNVGYAAIQNEISPEDLAQNGVPLEELSTEQLTEIFQANVSAGLYRRYESEMPYSERTQEEMLALVMERVVDPEVVKTWTLSESLLNRDEIDTLMAEKYPDAFLEFTSWLSADFISKPQSSDPIRAGVKTAILGSLWVIAITILFAFPVGVSAAIYLEEYAGDSWFNRIIQTNINNLAGVPSIIYGMLGLAIFVRAMEPITSGAIFGLVDDPTTANGRTILSAGLTLGLLILPLIIINAQEAIKAVPNSLRQAGMGLGATKWQTIWAHVLPNALPGILTGTILAISRAIGETAPLVVVGASTFITFNPESPFSKFTVLPIQIWQWTTRPQAEFRNLAAAAIIVLLVLLLLLNTTAVLLRNRYRIEY